MKKVNLFLMNLFIIICLFLVPNVVRANNSTANNWRLFCDNTVLTSDQTTDCYLIAQITDATDGGKPITAVLTNVSATKAEIIEAKQAFSYIQVEKTLASARFNNTLHGSKTNCDSTGNCYDFISTTGIVSNSSDAKITSRGFTGYTPIGYWTIKLNSNQITNDSDCGRICVSLEYVVDGAAAVGNVNTGNAVNASCIDINLKQEASATCYCNSADNKCYGANGTEVSREVYEAECNPKCSSGQMSAEDMKKYCTCTQEGGKFFGPDATEVTEDQYKALCSTKTCYQSNGKYYGKDGSEISKEQYEKDCIPKTGSFASYAVLASGALIALSAITVAKKHKKFYRV